MRKRKERKRHDKLGDFAETRRAASVPKHEAYWLAWRDFLPTTDDECRFTCVGCAVGFVRWPWIQGRPGAWDLFISIM